VGPRYTGWVSFKRSPDDQRRKYYFSRMPRRLANVENRFPGVKINTPNDRAVRRGIARRRRRRHMPPQRDTGPERKRRQSREGEQRVGLDPATIDTSIIIIRSAYAKWPFFLFRGTYYIR